MEKLHSDVTTNILSRLPAESVLDCKQVHKKWQALLTNHAFVDAHIKRQLRHLYHDGNQIQKSLSNDRCSPNLSFLVYVKRRRENKTDKLYHGEFIKQNIDGYPPYYMRYREIMNHPPLNNDQEIVGSCNGLICFSYYDNEKRPTYICNIMTKECIDIPRSKSSMENNFMLGTSGFGYVPSTGEYKIVNISYNGAHRYKGQVHVFTLGGVSGNNGKWRKLESINHSLCFRGRTRGVYLNGSLHWLDIEKETIVSFDLEDEQIRLQPLFKSRGPFFILGLQLSTFGGWLCLVDNNTDIIPGTCDMWLLKKNNHNNQNRIEKEGEVCESWSWVKEYSIALVPREVGHLDILSVTDNNELILRAFSHEACYLYDPKTTTLKVLGFGYGHIAPRVWKIVPHMDSFLLLKNPQVWEIIPHMNSLVSLKDLEEVATNI